ncbi:MAG: oxidoreductase [Marinosulfonomonas sp.]|nr:MAG: oxidoreductase [Marinosulfonomonas sp.]
MFEEFKGKTVLITGASSGIGAAVALAFGKLGANVGVHYNSNQDAAEDIATQIRAAGSRAHVVQADVSDVSAVESMIGNIAAEFGGIDILINNAGAMLERTTIVEASADHFHRVMDLNFTSVYAACHAVIPIMRKQGAGNIINVTSIAARSGGAAGSGIYAASKAAVSTLTRNLAKEEAPNNIRVNAVSPGVITTPFHEKVSTPAQMQAARATIPQGRLGNAQECVGTFLYLASDELSSYVDGQIIEVNGGQLMP